MPRDADHIIPRAIVRELGDKLYDLEFMPTKLNQRKGVSLGVRQRQLAETWKKLGLLSDVGFKAVMNSILVGT